MAMADVVELRFSGTQQDARPGPDIPADDGAPPPASAGAATGDATTSTAPAPSGDWPARWLSAVSARTQEAATADDGVHRNRGAQLLSTAGCRHLDVTGSRSDPASVRLTFVWGDDAPSDTERDAAVSWWVTASAEAGWEPAETDHLVGDVVVVRYVPTDRGLEEDVDRPVVRHDRGAPVSPRADTSRTSGRRT